MDKINLRILIVTGIYPPDIGGPASFSPEFATFLSQKGHKVTVVTLSDIATPEKADEFRVIRISRGKGFTRHLIAIYWITKIGRQVDRIISAGMYEEVGISSLFQKTPVIVRVVGDSVWERAKNCGKTNLNIIEFNYNTKQSRLQRLLLTWAIGRGNRVITPSLQLKALVQYWGVKREIHVAPNGVKIPTSSVNFNELRAITASRLVAWKNVELTLSVASTCKLPIKVLGDGPLATQLKQDFSHSEVQFLGRKSQKDVCAILPTCNVFILLSAYEGQSFALSEALSHGMFCIVSNVPGNEQIVKHLINGYVFDLQNIENSIALLKNFLLDLDRIREIAKNARNFAVSKLDSQVTSERTLQLVINL